MEKKGAAILIDMNFLWNPESLSTCLIERTGMFSRSAGDFSFMRASWRL